MGAGVGCSSSHWNAGAPEPSAAAGHRSRQAPFSQRAPTDLAANIPRTPPSLRNRSHQGRGRVCGLGDTSQRDPPPRWRDRALSSVPSPGPDLEGAAVVVGPDAGAQTSSGPQRRVSWRRRRWPRLPGDMPAAQPEASHLRSTLKTWAHREAQPQAAAALYV